MNESWPGSVSPLAGATMALVMPLMRVDGNQRCLRMERVVDMHVRHDLIAVFNVIIGHAVSRNFGQAKMGFRIDQAGINRHAGYVDHLGRLGNGRAAPPMAVIFPFCITTTPFSITP